jgi:hypothetical protein
MDQEREDYTDRRPRQSPRWLWWAWTVAWVTSAVVGLAFLTMYILVKNMFRL